MKKQSILRVFEIYRSNRSGQWGWRAKSTKNGKITFTGESHPSASNALRAIKQELAAVGATNPVRIEILSGKKRSIVYETMSPISKLAVPVSKLVEKPVRTLFIEDMGLARRTLNVLREEGLTTAAEISKRREAEIRKIPGVGEATYKDIVVGLFRHGLTLDKTPPAGKRSKGFLDLEWKSPK